jgi:hypothetical protein
MDSRDADSIPKARFDLMASAPGYGNIGFSTAAVPPPAECERGVPVSWFAYALCCAQGERSGIDRKGH